MVIGRGMLAQTFRSYTENQQMIFFTSGVSNSKEQRSEEFQRETLLLATTLREMAGKLVVYFSTTSCYDEDVRDSPYVLHKQQMENLIKNSGNDFIIFRVSNIVGPSANKFTIVNYLVDKITRDEPFELWGNASRNIIDLSDVYKIIDYIMQNCLSRNETVNVASGINTPVRELVKIIEEILGKCALFTIVEKGGSYKIDIEKIENIVRKIGIDFGGDYVKRSIKKYIDVL